MKALVFDGSPEGDPTGGRISGELIPILEAKGYETEHIVLRDKSIGNCNGCFGCWLKTPGICVIDDDNRELSEKFVQSDLLIMLTPVTFGGYSPELKRALDHFIANISPFFEKVKGETHHRKRYNSYPDLIVIGWQEEFDGMREAVFRNLVMRNSINFHSTKTGCAVIRTTRNHEAIRGELTDLLSNLRKPQVQPEGQRLSLPEPAALTRPVQKAVLLVGSPRLAKSSSASLGGYLAEELKSRGTATETFQICKALRDGNHLASLIEAVENADLCLLAFPLYIDSIPAPTLKLMQMIRDRKIPHAARGGCMSIVNCGFIEAYHNDTATAICAEFAKEAGFTWMGGVSIGGGEGLVHGRPLRDLRGPVIPYKKALNLVAEVLAKGQPVPVDAYRQLAKPFVPPLLYRFVGSLNWKKEARRNGISRRLGDQPWMVKK